MIAIALELLAHDRPPATGHLIQRLAIEDRALRLRWNHDPALGDHARLPFPRTLRAVSLLDGAFERLDHERVHRTSLAPGHTLQPCVEPVVDPGDDLPHRLDDSIPPHADITSGHDDGTNHRHPGQECPGRHAG